MSAVISAAVEGSLDEAVACRLIRYIGAQLGQVYNLGGKANLHRKISGYNNAAQYYPWLVLVDLDNDAECAPLLRNNWVPEPAPFLCFRVAVRAVEAWLIADAENLARFLSIPQSRIPCDPERLADPKTEMVNLARRSRKKWIRVDMVPRPGSGRKVGQAYTSRMIEFVYTSWSPAAAQARAPSLMRAIRCLKRLLSFT